MYGCIQKSLFSSTVKIYHQISEQNESTNEFVRRWVILKTLECSVLPIKETGSSVTSDNKYYSKDYVEELELKIHTSEQLSKRWRVSDLKNSSDELIYKEIDRISSPATIFEIVSSHPILDIFGNIQYYENHLKRVQVQKND